VAELITTGDVETLIAQINTAHAEAQAYAGKAIERALEAGDLLLLAKSQVAHGQWQSWLKEHCPAISIRTAQDYMRVAKSLPVEKRSAAHLTVRSALRILSDTEDDQPTNPDDQSPTAIDRSYAIFMTKKSELLNAKMESRLTGENSPLSVGTWSDKFSTLTDDRMGLRPYAINVIRHPSTSQKDVIAKLATLTIMVDGNLPVRQAMSALFADGNHERSVRFLNECVDLNPEGVNTFRELRSEVIRHFDNSPQVPF